MGKYGRERKDIKNNGKKDKMPALQISLGFAGIFL
jgi:hypothetical protein